MEKNDITKSDFSGKVIRMTRYCDATIVNLSTENKDITFNASPASAHATRGQKINKWAYYKETLEQTLMEAVGGNRSVSILVYRYSITSEGKDGKLVYDLRDVVVSATLNSI